MAHEKIIEKLEALVQDFNSEDFSIDCMEREFRAFVLLANLYADNNSPFASMKYIQKAEYKFQRYLRPDYKHAKVFADEMRIPENERFEFCDRTIDRFRRDYLNYMMAATKVIALRKKYMLNIEDIHLLN